MSAALALLDRLRGQGARLSLDGHDIEIDAPVGVIDAETKSELGRRKRQIAALMMAEASRPPSKQPPIPGSISALELKRVLGWDATKFSRFCHPLIGRPGPSTREEDEQVLDAMLDTIPEDSP